MSSIYTSAYDNLEDLYQEWAKKYGFNLQCTSAQIALFRLTVITHQDREACGDGRWELSGINLSGFYLESCLMKKENVSFENKPRCRWKVRT